MSWITFEVELTRFDDALVCGRNARIKRRCLMFFLGIDVASKKHDVAVLDDAGELIVEPFSIVNDSGGFSILLQTCHACSRNPQDMKIGMEDTGIYHEALRDWLIAKGYSVFVFNPLLTAMYRKSNSLRKTKTDAVDAIAIAKYLWANVRDLHPYSPRLYHALLLKSLSRQYQDVASRLSKRKVELKRLLHIAFPEFLSHFLPDAAWALQLLSKHPSAKSIASMRMKTLIDILRVHGDRLQAAQTLHRIAANSIGCDSAHSALLIQCAVEDILLIQSQIHRIKDAIRAVLPDTSPILTIPGVGLLCAASILGEIGDVRRFDNKFQLLAFCGIDPVIHQSGNFTAKQVHLSKRGSSPLRRSLFLAASAACVSPFVQDNKFRAKYLLKRAQGKHAYVAIFAAAKNLVYTIFAILKNNTPYSSLA